MGTDGLGREAHFDAVHVLGLEIYLECSPGGDIGVTPGIAGSGFSTSHLADAAHRGEG